ncbi:hypothetical protein MKJ01_05070 [Chryseobacterium sp. SSA4.19]|uniref:hypothetical protein n=1 Tax=Chryseobacterium sp. SSA4.19 TaxID=2919915 RepID=UPI001F4D8989|nr:hypothetical protein [Chryseobacterium sp. SSA4.19]MCJ8153135.1 hypothetical protein [Chryseobacterium sp. SSA4.19]
MKKIAYIEIDTHAEIMQGFMEIMQDSDEFQVDYYVSEKVKGQISNSGQNTFVSDSSMILEQLKKKKYDLVIIGTVHRYFNTFHAIVKKYNAAVIVHNINFMNASRLDLIKSIFKEDILYRIKLLWKEGLSEASEVFKKAKNLLILDEGLSSGRLRFLPVFHIGNFEHQPKQELVIAIPGGVSQKRRDYNHIFDTIRNLRTDENLEFIFLGKAKGKELKQLEELSSSLPLNITMTYFPERVSPQDFEKRMQQADVLWCPIRQETEFFSQTEVYGRTKMTGNVGDAIKYGKPAIFPVNYPYASDFIIPERKDILEQFKMLKDTSFDFQEKYAKEAVQKRTEKVLNQLTAI